MVRDYKKLLRISQVLNNSFGTDGPGGQLVNGFNVRLETVDETLLRAKAVMNVNFPSDQMMRELKRKYRKNCIAMIEGALKKAAADYEARFDEEIKFSFDEKTIEESIEFYQIGQYGGNSRAFYRVGVLVKVD